MAHFASKVGGVLTASRHIPCLLRGGNFLRQSGWFRSRALGLPVDKNGAPLPWYSYPMISFLGPRLTAQMRVLEFGSGQSTLWFAERVKDVIAIEEDGAWYDRVAATMPRNVTLLRSSIESYCKAGSDRGGRQSSERRRRHRF